MKNGTLNFSFILLEATAGGTFWNPAKQVIPWAGKFRSRGVFRALQRRFLELCTQTFRWICNRKPSKLLLLHLYQQIRPWRCYGWKYCTLRVVPLLCPGWCSGCPYCRRRLTCCRSLWCSYCRLCLFPFPYVPPPKKAVLFFKSLIYQKMRIRRQSSDNSIFRWNISFCLMVPSRFKYVWVNLRDPMCVKF